MTRRKESQQLFLFRLAKNMSFTSPSMFSPGIPEFMLKWKSHLAQTSEGTLSAVQLASTVAADMIDSLMGIQQSVMIMTTQLGCNCPDDIAKQHGCVVFRLVKSLEQTLVFEKVSETLKSVSDERQQRLNSLFDISLKTGSCCHSKCSIYEGLTSVHFVAFFIMSWPYKMAASTEGTLEMLYGNLVAEEIEKDDCSEGILAGEVNALKDQLDVLLEVCLDSDDDVRKYFKNRKRQNDACQSQI